jgi:hypothetical protein
MWEGGYMDLFHISGELYAIRKIGGNLFGGLADFCSECWREFVAPFWGEEFMCPLFEAGTNLSGLPMILVHI